MTRKVIQITAVQSDVGGYMTLVVLCDDGAILQYSPRETPPWTEFPKIPSRDEALKPVRSSVDPACGAV